MSKIKQLLQAGMAELNRQHPMNRMVDARLAYDDAEQSGTPLEQGRAARNMSWAAGKMGWLADAERWAAEAHEIHSLAFVNDPSVETWRELAMSEISVGVVGLRKRAIARRDEDDFRDIDPRAWMHQGKESLKKARSFALGLDQYEIDAARQLSMAESLFGEHKRGFRLGVRATLMAFFSESPRFSTSNTELSSHQRMHAKARAFLGGIAAVGVSVLAARADETSQHVAWRLAEKTL